MLTGAVIGAFSVATFGIGALGAFGAVVGEISLFTGIGAIGTAVAGAIAGGALGGALGLLKPKIPELSTEFGRELQLNGDPLAPRKIGYGESWTAGTLRFHGTVGDNNEDLYLVIVLVGHEIDSVQEAEFDGDTLTLDGAGDVTAPSKWAGLINVRYYLGTDDQTADATLQSEFAEWTTDHRLRGLPYAIVKLSFDEENLSALPKMLFRGRWRKVYDPRKDDTNGGTGTHRLADPTTWEWSRNAALCAADFMRSPKVNNRAIAGLRVSDGRVAWANVIAEANVCDEDVTLADASTQARYTVDGFIDPRKDHGQNLRHFEVAMAGDITFADGKWRIFAGAFRSPTLHLEDKHFVGPLQHQVHKGEAQRVDTAQGSFASASDSGDVLDYPPVPLASAIVGEERIFPLNFQLVADGARVQRCAKLLLEREAAGKRISCTTNLYGFRAVPGETINLTHSAFGLDTQAMRVLDVQLSTVQVDDNKVGLVCNLVLEAGPSSLYAWNAEETAIAAAPVIPRAQVPFSVSFPDLVGKLTNSLVNPGFESGNLGGWTATNGTWSASETDPRFGTYSAEATTSTGLLTLRNTSRLQVEEGDRVLAQGFVRRSGSAGAEARSCRVVIRFRDAADAEVGAAGGTIVTNTSYELSRTIGVTPAGAVTAEFEFQGLSHTGDPQGMLADGAYMAIIPKDSDIDLGQASGAVDTGRIDDGAVTDPHVTHEPADGDISYPADTQPAVEASGLNGYVSYTAPASFAAQVTIAWSAQAQISNTTSGTAVGKAEISIGMTVNSSVVFRKKLIIESFTDVDDWGLFSGVHSETVPAGQEIEAFLNVGREFSTSGSSPAQTITWRDSFLNLVATKR